MKKNQEIELKLHSPHPLEPAPLVHALATAGYTVDPTGSVHQTDLYIDTPAWSLMKHRLALRLRVADSQIAYQIKTISPVHDGVTNRTEITLPLTQVPPDPGNLPEGELSRMIHSISGSDTLIVQCHVITNRQRFLLILPDTTRVELALDSTQFVSPSAPHTTTRIFEVEAELLSGDPEKLHCLGSILSSRFPLTPSRHSKLESAVILLHLSAPLP